MAPDDQKTEIEALEKATLRDLPSIIATSSGTPKADSLGALAALRRAALKAQREAIETIGYFPVWRDGKVAYATELETTEEDLRILEEAEKKSLAEIEATEVQYIEKEAVASSD